MDIINPFEELVVFGKKLPLEPQRSTIIAALRPTGRHVSHANDLTHVRGVASGGAATKLERYTTSVRGLHPGPFKGSVSQPRTKLVEVKGSGKGFGTGPFRKSLSTAIGDAASGLKKLKPAAPVKVPGKVPLPPSASLQPTRSIGALPLGKSVNSNIPSGASKGGRL